jgi:hypothetical protein
MSDSQRDKLEEIGFMFELPDDLKPPEPVDWEVAYEELVKYRKSHGNCLVPQSTVVEGKDGREIKLGKWYTLLSLLIHTSLHIYILIIKANNSFFKFSESTWSLHQYTGFTSIDN